MIATLRIAAVPKEPYPSWKVLAEHVIQAKPPAAPRALVEAMLSRLDIPEWMARTRRGVERVDPPHLRTVTDAMTEEAIAATTATSNKPLADLAVEAGRRAGADPYRARGGS